MSPNQEDIGDYLPESKDAPYDLHTRKPDSRRHDLKHKVILGKISGRSCWKECTHTGDHPDNVPACEDSINFLGSMREPIASDNRESSLTLSSVPNMCNSSFIPET